MSALTAMISFGTTAAQWSAALMASTSEAGLLVLWGALLFAAGQSVSVRARGHASQAPAESRQTAAEFFDTVAAPHAQTARG